METACKVWSSVLVLFFLELCNALPINLENSGPDSHTQFLTGLVAVLLTVCSVVLLAGCLCCQRRNGFKEFRDSPVAASVANSLDHGHVNPIANSEFTIFTPISPPHHNNNVFLANQRIVSRTQDDYKYGDIDVTYWFDGSEEDFPRKKLKYIKELGKGWFGRVVEGTAQGLSKNPEEWCPVAVRILEASASSRERVLFLYDATIYRCGSHPNILRVVGRSLDTIPLLLLQEYYTEGDLKRYLRNNKATCDKFLSSDYPLLWCYQLTSAVKFLHSCRVTHPDLAARNCQLTQDLQLKLGDYGLSATLYPEDYYEGAPAVPLRWCAPETISYTSTTIQLKQITFEGNVWSLGVTLWEICECGDQPYSWLTDDEVVSQVIETPKVRLPRPSYSTIYTDYLYRLMQSCWSTVESRASIFQIELMLADLMQVYEHTKVISYGEEASVSIQDFDKRWEALKPNKTEIEEQDLRSLNALNLHMSNADDILNDKRLSASMNNLHGSLDNLLEYKNSFDPMESWLENVACNTGDMSYVKGLSEAIKDLDNAIAFENVSSDSSHQQSPIPDVIPRQSKLQFKLGQVFKPSFSELAQNEQRTSSESETEDEAWRKKIERGAYSEKVRQKSRSVTDLMVLTHIDCSESDSETTLPSIDYKTNHRNMRYIKNMENSSMKFGSEGNLLNVQDTFQEELRKLQEERRDSLLFVPDNRSQSSVGDVSKVTRDLPNVVANSSPVKKLFEELNNPVDIVPAKQVYNVFNVSVEQKYSSLCPIQNLSAPEPKTANQINKIKTTNISDNTCLITPEKDFENTDNNYVLNNSEITPSNDVPEINTNSEVADNNRVDVCNICSAVNSETAFSVETQVNKKENRLENLISFADTDRNYNQIKQVSLRSQQDLIKTWLSEDIFSINEEERPLKNNKFEAENELSVKELIKRENSHNLKRDCANFLSSQLHSVDGFDYENKHQVPKLVDIIQNNIKLLDYIIVNDKDKLPNYCEVKKANENFQQKSFNSSISIEDNEHIQYHTSEANFDDESGELQNKDENKIFNNRNYNVSKMHEEKTVVPLLDVKQISEVQIPEVKLEDIQLTEVTPKETSLNDLNHKFVPITNNIDDSHANVQELQTSNKQTSSDLLVDSKKQVIKIEETGIGIKEQDIKYYDVLKLEEVKLEKTFDLDLGYVQTSTNSDNAKQIQKVDLDLAFDESTLNNLSISPIDLDVVLITAKDETQSKGEEELKPTTNPDKLVLPTAFEIGTATMSKDSESKENTYLEKHIETSSFNDAPGDVVDVEEKQTDVNETNTNFDSSQDENEIKCKKSKVLQAQLHVNKIEDEQHKLHDENEAKSLNEDVQVEESNCPRSEVNSDETEVGELNITNSLNQEESGELKLINEINYERLREEEIDVTHLEKMIEISDSFIKEERKGEKVTDSNFMKPSELKESYETTQEVETEKGRNQTEPNDEPTAEGEESQNETAKLGTAKEANTTLKIETEDDSNLFDDERTLNADEEKVTTKSKTEKEENTSKMILNTTNEAKVIEGDSNFSKDELILSTTEENVLQQETTKAGTAKKININEMAIDLKKTEDNSNLFDERLTLNADEGEVTTKSRTEKEENANKMTINEVQEIEGDSSFVKDESILTTTEEKDLNVLQQETRKASTVKETSTNELMAVDVEKTEDNSNLFDVGLILIVDEGEGTMKSKTEKEENTIKTSTNEVPGFEDDSNFIQDELILNTLEKRDLNILQQETTKAGTVKEANTNEMAHVVMVDVKKTEDDSNLFDNGLTLNVDEGEVTMKSRTEKEENTIKASTNEVPEIEDDSNFFKDETNSNTMEEKDLQQETTEEITILNATVNAKVTEDNSNLLTDEINLQEETTKTGLNEEEDTNKTKEANVPVKILSNKPVYKTKEEKTSNNLQKGPTQATLEEEKEKIKNEAEVLKPEELVKLERTDFNDQKVSLTQVFLEVEKVAQPKQKDERSEDKILHGSNLLDKDTELEKLNTEISLNKTKGLDTSSEKIIDKLTQIIKAEKQKQTPKSSESDLNRVQTRDFLNNEVQYYAGGQQNKPQVQFDLSENQQEISPNSLTHYSAFAGTPGGMKRSLDSIVILGASDDYSIDYYSGLKTSTEESNELQFSSNFVQDGAQKPFRFRTSDAQDHSDMKYSLETWDNFLDKTFDDQNSRSTDFSNFSEEPQSLLFLDTENYEVKGKGAVRNQPSPKIDEQVADLNVSGNEDVKSEDKQSQKETDSDGSWEAGGGWFLHPRTSSEEPTGQIAPCTSESYVGFSMDDEIMTALRNELLSKLPHAQRASNDKVEDCEELDDTSEKNEVFVRYNVYSTPLSPIPEETYVDSDESRCATPQRYDSSDDDSDWSIQDNNSPYNRTETQSPKLTEKEPLNRHTPSQDSCCSNDTLFNLEELNAANDHEKAADVAVKIESEIKQDEEENSDSQNLTVNNEETLEAIPNTDAKTSTSFNVPKISVHNYVQEFLNNERFGQLDSNFKPEENKSENEEGSTNSDVYLSVNDNTFTFGQSVAPLNSPEDKPWKELQASFRQCEEDEMIEDKDILEALNESDGNEQNNTAANTGDEVILEGSPDNIEYASVEDLKNKMNLSVEETKAGSEVVNDDLDSSSDVDDARPKVLESSSDSCDDMYGPLTDIRFSGPANIELMTTSFNEGTDLMEEQDWDSGSDSRSSSSGEFIWREGEHEASVKALRAAPQSENLNNVAPMEHIQEECESSSCTSDSETEEECPEFVPSAWDKFATPTKSALRSPEKSLERTEKGKKSKGVWFKKQKYHCVYEYPREPESPLLQSYDLWQPAPDYSTIADWDLDSNSYLPTTLDEPDCASQDYEVKNDKYPKNLYHLTTFPDLTMGTTMLDEDFFISSSSRPFDMLGGLTSQFFPGKQFLDNWNENVTPDSGVEDVIPLASLVDSQETRLKSQVPSLKSLAAAIVKQNENRNTVLGGLRHTRNKLKLDLPPSPSAFTSSRSFTVEPVEEILNRQAPTFTTFGKSRFLVQQVDTTLDDKQSQNVSFEAIPYKPAKQFYKNDFDRETHKVEIVKGEASLLDSADEDSGIESCTLERKKGVDV